VEQAQSMCRRLVGLVNNASLFTPGNLADPAHLAALLESNALVPAALAAAFAARARSGWIVNITDANIKAPNRTWQNYRISKLLLEELTRQQAFLCAPRFRVNAIAPGAILPASGSSAASFRALADRIPLRRTGSLADIRAAFAGLLSAPYVTGQVLYVDGGRHVSD
jgi:NAD(P)-dependent dehydrogenase (short-subunit alcohol dehydrogenase family)